MKNELQPGSGVYWVGGIDWDLRDFHGYTTERGSSYNAYLIVDTKVVLIDTAKHYLVDEMIARIREIIDPAKIDIIISNHTEMDHSGGLPRMAALCPNAKILASTNGVKGLAKHFPGLAVAAVKDGETLSTGKYTLSFHYAQMVHWPDNMAAYLRELKILFSNDAFGQHIASAHLFDDENNEGVLMEEAAKYYANIVLPYGNQVQKVLAALSPLAIGIIAPSHGIIWRKYIPELIANYQRWSKNETKREAIIIYDTMWNSTALLARALADGIADAGVPVSLVHAGKTHLSEIVTELLETKLICIGSSTLNNNMLATIGGFLYYLKGLAPKDRVGFAFGSYGWGGQAPKDINEIMTAMGWELPKEPLRVNYVPTTDDIAGARTAGIELAQHILSK